VRGKRLKTQVSLKPRIKLLPLAIGFGLDVILALDFNEDDLLGTFFWVHNDWALSA
jgi:membrane-associated PAP2 superfamily phosphatase